MNQIKQLEYYRINHDILNNDIALKIGECHG